MTAEIATFTAPRRLAEQVEYAKLLAESDMLPAQFRKKPANVLWAQGFGEMLEIHPIAAMIDVNVIEGKPSASAGLISGLVRRAGHRLRSRIEHEDSGAPKAIVEITRSDDPEYVFRSEWTIERAVRAGLCKVQDGRVVARSQAGKPLPWEAYTEAMLTARATSECARAACQEALSGIKYTPEELGADVDEDGNVVKPASSTPVQNPVDEPIEDAVIVPDEPAVPAKRQGTRRSKEDIFSVSELVTRIYNADPSEIPALFAEAERAGVLEETTLDREQQATTVRGLLVQRQLDAPVSGDRDE